MNPLMLLFAHLGLTLAAAQTTRKLINPAMGFVILGSMLPDIIDKPLGWAIYGTPAMGRIYAHTLVFLLALIAISLLARSKAVASMTGGVGAHLILDSMWASPVILFWPILGDFPINIEINPEGHLKMILAGLMNPWISVPEALGIIYLAYYLLRVDSGILERIKVMRKTAKSSGVDDPGAG